MKKTDKKLKALVLSIGLGVAMLTVTSAQAQMINLLDEYYDELDQQSSDNASLLQRGNTTFIDDAECGIQIGNFEEVVPLGGGIAILLVAGLGYVALKKKEDKQ